MPILLITLVGAALRFYGLGHQGVWYDESYTFALIKLSPGRMLGQIPLTESTPPLYYCLAWIWARIFDFGSAGVRSLSALTGTATIPVVYAAARKLLHGRRAALIAAALTACNPLLIWYSQEARSYELLVLLSACTLLAFAYARERPRPLALALWAIACALALTTHYYAILLVAPEAAWLLFEHRHRRFVHVATALLVVVELPLIVLAHKQSGSGNDAWIAHSPFGPRLTQVLPLFLIGPETPARVLLKFVAFAVVLAALALLWRGSRRRERQGALLPAGLAVSGFVLSLVLIAVSDSFLTRNLLALWVPAALVVAAGLGVARARLAGPALALALCVVGIVASVGVASDYYLQRPNWQDVARLIGPRPAAGRRIVLVQDNAEGMPLALYMPGLRYVRGSAATGVTQVDIISVRRIPGLGGFCWWGSACNLVPSRLERHPEIPGFHLVFRRRVRQFWVAQLVSSTPATVTRASLQLASRRTRLKSDSLLIQP